MRKALAVAVTVGLVAFAVMALGEGNFEVVAKWFLVLMSMVVVVVLPVVVVLLLSIWAWPTSTSSSIPPVLLIVSTFSSLVIALKYWSPKFQAFAIWLGIVH